ncbi:LytR C-terminal domain-containing protein [Allokutzneria sp. A3M-2-11 16]|uniref:LytR C-terminal domain-containing protein n=1 Tax=Allokutzneria sp. A3M-2-11 16 TaxID=2962043 RepID=UPI0020B8B391|nr:LytR C-terminal domain-containing protein [Allokutzneria sp. A3M-2-11 16]MCP3800052.1 LytR C-terminal domain-containing protein [Allokutzneria sp. A3M-2-11 16]
MSSVEPPSAPRPLWVAGVVALGVAAVALAFGVFSLFNGSTPTDQLGQQPTTTTEPAPVSPPPPAVSSSEVPPVTTTPPPPPPTTTTAPPSTTNDNGGNPPSKPKTGIRVYNNSTIPKLADRAAQDIREAGWTVEQVDNYPHGVIYTTTVYYTPGTDEETTARTLASEFGMRVEERFEGIKDAKPGVIVIVTKDYRNAANAK